MAYIATKATYIGEEEVKDENGKPVVDDNGNPVKKIKTDVDDVIFATGEVIVLIEEVNKGQHFDLSIEDKGSTYFAPTQIKIGDGMHSFGELNWLQTIDDFKVQSTIDKKIATYKTNVDKTYETFTNSINAKIGEQNQRISTFIDVDSKEILKNLIQDNYFSLSSNGVLSAFYDTSISTANNLKSFSIGSSNSFNNNATNQIGRDCITFGTKNNTFGFNNYSFGYNNNISGAYVLTHGSQNTVTTNEKNKLTVCFGHKNQIFNNNSVVIGTENSSSGGEYSICLGKSSSTGGDHSIAIGNNNKATDDLSIAIGHGNTASGPVSIAVGGVNQSSQTYSIAIGASNIVTGPCSVAMGDSNKASDFSSVAMGYKNSTSGQCSIAMGRDNAASGEHSVSIGTGLIAVGDYQTALGKFNIDETELDIRNLFVLGNGTDATNRSNAMTVDWNGNLGLSGGITNLNSGNNLSGENGSHGLIAMGGGNTASGTYSVAIGGGCRATGQNSLAMGGGNTASGECSVAIGAGCSATEQYSLAFGNGTASGISSLAFGNGNTASGQYSVAIGEHCRSSVSKGVAIGVNCTVGNDDNTSGYNSFALGAGCRALSSYSMTFGASCSVIGDYSFAGGAACNARGLFSVSLGRNSDSYGDCSVSIGDNLIAVGENQTVFGKYNVDETEFDMRNLFVLGNGTSTSNRSNAMAVDVAGNLNMNQDVVANAFGESPISLVELSNRIGIVEEKLSKLVTPEG